MHFIRDLFAPGNLLFRDIVSDGGQRPRNKLLFVVDRGLYRYHPGLPGAIQSYLRAHQRHLILAGPPLLVEGGEGVKNDPQYVAWVHEAIHAAGLCRHSYLVAVGGGAVIDMAGFAAATAHRGLRLIRVPTTVLAQADAAIGVKNGINAFGKKNFIGAFAPPGAVINDFCFLATLSHRDWLSGVAEAVKVALIKDASFFDYLEANAPALAGRSQKVMEQVIYRCAALHLEHIASAGDPFEFGASRPLDFGHWSAHKLEQLSNFELRHGEAVAIGIALDTTYSCLTGILPKADGQRVLTTLANLGFALYTPELEDPALPDGLREFQEHLGGRLTITLLWNIGHGLEVHDIDPGLIRASIALLRKYEAKPVRAVSG